MIHLRLIAYLALISLAVSSKCQSADDFSARDYGAKGDGVAFDTAAIQAAIDACNTAGGGAVTVAPGTYLVGTIELKSNVELRIEKGGVLLGSKNLEDYPARVPNLRSYTDKYTRHSIIYAESAENISITGEGTINGQGAAFDNATYARPNGMRIISCRNVAVRGIRMVDGAMWMCHFLSCTDVYVSGVTIRSRVNKNNDGLDIDGCRNVRISDCDISSGDDAIVLKSTSPLPSENVVISNCVLSTACNAIKMGTESTGGFKNIAITNCVVYDTRLSGVALEIVDGGTMDGICVSNIAMNGVGCPIFVRLGNRARPYKPGADTPHIGVLRNVAIANIEATASDTVGCSITGMPGHPVENISLDHVRIRFPGGNDGSTVAAPVPEAAEKYPEYKMFGTLPAYGFYCRHARNLSFNNVEVGFDKADARPAVVCDDVEQLDIVRLVAAASNPEPGVLWFAGTRDARVTGCRATGSVKKFLRSDGPGSRNIVARDNELPRRTHAIDAGKGVKYKSR